MINANKIIESIGSWKKSHSCGELQKKDIGERVTLMGWVQSRRDHGGLIFLDLRDRKGITQIVFDPKESLEVHQKAHNIKNEYVIAIEGIVIQRLAGYENPKMYTGQIEVKATKLTREFCICTFGLQLSSTLYTSTWLLSKVSK